MQATQTSISVSRMNDHSRMDHPPVSSYSPSHSSSYRLPSSRAVDERSSLAPFVDLEFSPYSPQPEEQPERAIAAKNPLPDLIPDELFQLLRSNDLINEKGVRDYIIRRAFKAMREQHELKSSEALERLQAVYPYLQVDTIRKIIYRIGPGSNRKVF